jgi:LPXTG-motif cell wall-anchored protein
LIKRLRTLLMVGLVAGSGLGLAGNALAQPGENGIPIDAPEDCVEEVMDLPALNVCKDAQGRHLLDLPAIGTLREPDAPAAPASKGSLPKTGLHTEDFMAIGMAALAGGAVLLRRLRLAVS